MGGQHCFSGWQVDGNTLLARFHGGTVCALGFTGEPVVNWFYTFGKPVGPVHGTRYRDVWAEGQDAWSGALSFEFNYKVVGRAR